LVKLLRERLGLVPAEEEEIEEMVPWSPSRRHTRESNFCCVRRLAPALPALFV
jgi:hypothetical protein